MRPGDTLQLYPCLEFLQRRVPGLHVGGKSALAWHGIHHYVAQRDMLHLYGCNAATLPPWFVERFPSEYHRKRLFEEEVGALLHVSRFLMHWQVRNGPSVSGRGFELCHRWPARRTSAGRPTCVACGAAVMAGPFSLSSSIAALESCWDGTSLAAVDREQLRRRSSKR